MRAEEVQCLLRDLADEATARVLRRFFKTGPGKYGEGDQFLGIKVPQLRSVARDCQGLAVAEAERLLQSPVHECRLLALLLLVQAFVEGSSRLAR
jgi:hypothetical protein